MGDPSPVYRAVHRAYGFLFVGGFGLTIASIASFCEGASLLLPAGGDSYSFPGEPLSFLGDS